MIRAEISGTFESWRTQARSYLFDEVKPQLIDWADSNDDQGTLLELFQTTEHQNKLSQPVHSSTHRVPVEFIQRAEIVSAHRDTGRWALLYRMLWRLTHGEAHLLDMSIDPDVSLFDSYFRLVRRDMHKMKAFVRFKEMKDPKSGEIYYTAWYRPDYNIVRLVAPFFARRFASMKWSILTEDQSAYWDTVQLTYTAGVPRSRAETQDQTESLWKTYYSSIFNPARIKLRAMSKELPKRYWATLPETEVIRELLRDSPARLQDFYHRQTPSAERWLPPPSKSPQDKQSQWNDLRKAAQLCQACGICENATQAVFGEGPLDAKIVIIGEQPGDQEDRKGRPFMGPAGQLLDQALMEAGIDRSQIYLTNAVKHFKWKPQGKLRLHQRPSSGEISACKPWFLREMQIIRPEILICLGASAAQSVLGKQIKLADARGQAWKTQWTDQTWVTIHPSAILRTSTPDTQAQEYERLVQDLKSAVALG